MASPLLPHRRRFIKQLAAGALAAPFITRHLRSAPPSGRLRHASFGAGGMAWIDLQAICSSPFVDLVAVADVDLNQVAEVKAAYPDVRIYQDWRELLDREHREIDSVNVSTPDHLHAIMALGAMQLGKHVYCQKPLTHSLHESRVLAEFAQDRPLVTQMGIQVHATKAYREAVTLVQSGVIGKVREVHTWSNKHWGDQGAPPAPGAIPDGFDWDLWLGGAAERPYVADGYYHPGNWRKRLDFGTGTFGDMGCHIFDPVFEALALTAPVSVRSDGPAPDAWNWSVNAIIRYVFAGTPFTADETVPVTWYDGNQRPPADVLALVDEPVTGDQPERMRQLQARRLEQGSIIIGTKGVLHVPHVETPRLFPRQSFADYPLPEVASTNHWTDWTEACVGQASKPLAPFSYAGPLTEAVLLGCVAVRFPQTTLKWNSDRLRFDNLDEANQFVRRSYRPGWAV